MAELIVIAISFPSATNAKPKKNPALVLLVKTKRLSVPESVAQKRRLPPKPLRYTNAKRRLARPLIARPPRRTRRKPRMKSVSREMQSALITRNFRHRRNDRRFSPTHVRAILKLSRRASGRIV